MNFADRKIPEELEKLFGEAHASGADIRMGYDIRNRNDKGDGDLVLILQIPAALDSEYAVGRWSGPFKSDVFNTAALERGWPRFSGTWWSDIK